jgi:hypothetical protein
MAALESKAASEDGAALAKSVENFRLLMEAVPVDDP